VFDSRSTRRPCSRARHPLLTRVPPQCHAPARALLLHNECQSFHTPSSHSRCRFSLRRSLCAELRPWPPLPSGEAPAPLLFLHLRAFSEPTECATTFTVICRPPLRPFFCRHGRRSAVAAGAAAGVPPARAASRPQATSGHAAPTYKCAPTSWCFPITPLPPTSSLRPQQQAPTTSPALIRVRGCVQQLEEREGPKCITTDSYE
jgi:hypothetical protein